MIYLATFHNDEDNMTSVVFESNHKVGTRQSTTYGVALRDDDSGKFVGMSFHGFQTLEAAIAKAKTVL